MIEFFDILDESGNKIGQVCPRSVAHENGFLHGTAHIWIVNSHNQILLQKRSLTKETHPGLWDISCAGHLSAGDSPLDAAVRECREELGLTIESSQLNFLFTIRQSYISPDKKITDNELSSVYFYRISDDTKFTLSSDEVEQVRFFDIPTFKTMVLSNDPQLVPHNEEYSKILSYIQDNQ